MRKRGKKTLLLLLCCLLFSFFCSSNAWAAGCWYASGQETGVSQS